MSEKNQRSLSEKDLIKYNSYYKRSDIRRIVFGLNKGVCQVTGKLISFDDAHVGHIVPRSRPEDFSKIFSSLDVDNLINLFLINKKDNLKTSNFTVLSPHILGERFNYNSRLIQQRLHKVVSENETDIYALKDSLGVNKVFDFQDVYDKAICFGYCHALPLAEFENKISDSNICRSDFISSVFKDEGYIYGGQRLRGDLVWFSTRYDKDSKLAKLLCDRNVHPIEQLGLPLGEWIIIEGEASAAPRQHDFIFNNSNEKHVLRIIDLVELCDKLLTLSVKYKRKYLVSNDDKTLSSLDIKIVSMNQCFNYGWEFPEFAKFSKGCECGTIDETIDVFNNCTVIRRKDVVKLRKKAIKVIEELNSSMKGPSAEDLEEHLNEAKGQLRTSSKQ